MWSRFKSPSSRWSSAHQEVERLYPRFHLLRDDLCTIRIHDTFAGKLIEIGYGGCSFAVEASVERRLQLLQQGGSKITADIELLGHRHQLHAAISHSKAGKVGMCFQHDRSKDFTFLQDFLGPLSFGAEMAAAAAGRQDQVAIRGDGLRNGDVSIRTGGAGGAIEEVWLRYKRHKISFETQITARGISTRHDIGPGGELTEMTRTQGVDPDVLRMALLILHGFAQQHGEALIRDAFDFALQAAAKDLGLSLSGQKPLRRVSG